jgi:hypothetical protein
VISWLQSFLLFKFQLGRYVKDVLEMCKGIFVGGSVQYGFTTIPTYPSGQIGFVMCSKPDEEGKTVDFTKPHRPPPTAPGAFAFYFFPLTIFSLPLCTASPSFLNLIFSRYASLSLSPEEESDNTKKQRSVQGCS